MGKVAFVFSGQGAQRAGMGKDLYDNKPSSAAVFRSLDRIRPGTSAQCFSASDEELGQTSNTQPCMFAVELAAAAALTDAGVRCDMTAGFSLGEIAALTYAGAVSPEDGFKLVCRRAQLMQHDAEQADSGMAAVISLDSAEVERLCSLYEHVHPVNYNCPGQVSVAGLKTELEAFTKDVKAAGGRIIPLRVRGAFHSPFMAQASKAFGEILKEVELKTPAITLYSNYTGIPYSGDFADLLSKQICNPVRWQSIVEHMISAGADTFVEIGPGSTLCGLIKKINPAVRTFHVEDCASLNEAVEGAASC